MLTPEPQPPADRQSQGGRVDLVVPARNEEANIPRLLAAIQPHRESGLIRRVIVADNGSRDRTAALARSGGTVVVHEPTPGYGGACLAALGHIIQSADDGKMEAPLAVVFLDADLADDPAGLPALLAPILKHRADLVIGCRGALARPGALDPHQRFGNRLACELLRLTTGKRYRDVGPMRAMRWSSLRQLAMADRTWGWTVEMQFKAARRGLRIEQIDVPYRSRTAGKSKISGSLVGSARAGVKIIATIAALWARELMGRPRSSPCAAAAGRG